MESLDQIGLEEDVPDGYADSAQYEINCHDDAKPEMGLFEGNYGGGRHSCYPKC